MDRCQECDDRKDADAASAAAASRRHLGACFFAPRRCVRGRVCVCACVSVFGCESVFGSGHPCMSVWLGSTGGCTRISRIVHRCVTECVDAFPPDHPAPHPTGFLGCRRVVGTNQKADNFSGLRERGDERLTTRNKTKKQHCATLQKKTHRHLPWGCSRRPQDAAAVERRSSSFLIKEEREGSSRERARVFALCLPAQHTTRKHASLARQLGGGGGQGGGQLGAV